MAQVTCTENLMKFGHVVSSMRTDIWYADSILILRTPTRRLHRSASTWLLYQLVWVLSGKYDYAKVTSSVRMCAGRALIIVHDTGCFGDS